jgi:Kef-type K+ transport system membrane component KefB
MTDATQTATGETPSGLMWMVLGAAALVAVVAPILSAKLGISPLISVIVAGVALAYFAKGNFRKAGQGAAVYGIASLAMAYVGPMLSNIAGGLFGGGQATARKNVPAGVTL